MGHGRARLVRGSQIHAAEHEVFQHGVVASLCRVVAACLALLVLQLCPSNAVSSCSFLLLPRPDDKLEDGKVAAQSSGMRTCHATCVLCTQINAVGA